MRLFRRREREKELPEEQTEEQEDHIDDLPEVAEAAPEAESRRRFRPFRGRRPADPVAADEELEPLEMEIAGSHRFTLVEERPGDTEAKPIPPPHKTRRILPWRRRLDPMAELAALVAEEEEEGEGEVEIKEARTARRVRLPWRIRPGVLLLALALFGVAGTGVLLNRGAESEAVIGLWSLGMMGVSAVSLPSVLRRRDASALLGVFSLTAVGVTLLLTTAADVLPLGATLAATLVMALGFTITIRGVLAYNTGEYETDDIHEQTRRNRI